jgi:hypothetical protein
MAKGKGKKALNKLKGKAKNLGKHIIEAEKNLAKGVSQAVLLPYAPFMKIAVKKKGATPEKKIIPLAKQFMQLVVKSDNSSTYEMAYYECLSEQQNYEGNQTEHLVEDIGSIIKLVVEWIKKAQAKKQSGQPLTELEESALNEAEKIKEVEKKINEEEDESKSGGFKDISKSFSSNTIKYVVIIAVAAFVIYKIK